MARFHRFLLSFLMLMSAGAVAVADGPIDVSDPPSGRFLDEWAEVYLAGGKVGYAHSIMAREDNRIRTTTTTRMKLGRVDAPIVVEIVEATTETLEGAPLRFSTEMDMSVMKSSMRGTVADGKVTIVSTQAGMAQTQAFDFRKGALMTWGLFRESLRRGFKPGLHYSVKAYAPSLRLDDAVDAETTVGEWETFTFAGKPKRGQKVTVTLSSPIGETELVSWVDKFGRPIKAVVPAAGLGDMVILTSNEAAALADFVPPEVFMKTTIAAKRKIDRKNTERITYRIRPTTPDGKIGSLPTTAMQRSTPAPDGSVTLVVTRQPHERPKGRETANRAGAATGISPDSVNTLRSTNGPRPTNGPDSAHDPSSEKPQETDLTEYLDSNLMMNAADPKLIELAKRAAGGETDPYALGDRLRRFVSDYVKTKSLNIGFATASEVCRTREGDCSEHGVLLAALGRLNHLPSRVVVGLAYVPSFGGRKDIFGYHLWTQFYIDGRWVDFDAALEETECSPARIAFATSSLKNAGLADLSLPLLNKIGAIDIDILKVETRSR